MPLSEFLYRLAKEKNSNRSTDLPQGGDNDFVELVWENGQIQSSKARKLQNSNLAQNLKIRNKDLGNGRFGVGSSGIDEVPISVSSGLHQDDEMVPWLNYPVDDLLQQDYCSEFLSELSGVTINEHSQNTFTSLDKRNGLNSDQGQMPKASSVGDSDVTRVRTSSSQLYPPSSQQCQFPHLRSQVLSSNHEAIRTPTDHDSMRVSCSRANFPNPKQQPLQPNSSSGLMNFSHFLRPAKATFQNIGSRAGSGLADIERAGIKDKNSTNEQMNFDFKPAEEPVAQRKLETLDQRDESKSDKQCVQVAESAVKGLVEGEKNSEPMVTSSSVCSGSDEPMQNLKRKNREADSSEGPSEENEEEPAGAKRGAQARGCKRTRAAEVHNLSERRRRDRINEKMRALQELIPNCNKVDKASMLDEAIEYLKTLQLQVQIMSMGSGLYMPPMMMGPGFSHMHAAHMAQFGSMGVGMGMGFGMGMPDMIGGSPGCSMVQMPHFPGPTMAGPGMGGSGFPVYGMPSQGHPMQYPCPPMMPVAGAPAMRPMGVTGGVMGGPGNNLGSGPGSCSKDPIQNAYLQPIQNDGANSSMNQMATQCQVTEECGGKPGLVRNGVQTSEVTDNGALKPAIGKDNVPS